MLTDKMNILQAMKDALESLIRCKTDNEHRLQTGGITVIVGSHYTEEPIESLRAAIAAYEQQIEEMEKAEPVAQVTSFGCQPLRQFDVHEWGTPLYLHPSLAIPEGWQFVPKEPTESIILAGCEIDLEEETPEHYRAFVAEMYRAMLAAAPEYNP